VSVKLSTADKVALGAGVAALAGGIGAAIYGHWDDIKRFFKWGNLASGAVEDSALLLETKLDHATALCEEHLVDIDALRSAISAADAEAHKLVSVNKQLRSRLDALRAAIPTGASDAKAL
jgi:TnpA family transposase